MYVVDILRLQVQLTFKGILLQVLNRINFLYIIYAKQNGCWKFYNKTIKSRKTWISSEFLTISEKVKKLSI